MKHPTTVFAILLLVAGLQSAVLCKNIVPPTGEKEDSNSGGVNTKDQSGTVGSNIFAESSTITRKVNLAAPETNGKNINNGIESLENGKSRNVMPYPKEKFSAKVAASDRANSVSKGNKERDYVGFPPYRGSNSVPYQRQRRSYHTAPIPLMNPDIRPYSNYAQPDELEFNLNNVQDREAFLELLAMLRSNEMPLVKNDDENLEDYDEPSLDYRKQPFAPEWNKIGSEPISLMSSSPGLNLPSRNKPSNGFFDPSGSPSSYSFHDSPLPLRDGDDSPVDDSWMDDAIPLHSHSKTRRAGNPVAMSMGYSSSPIKSHFRMLRSLRKPGKDLYFSSFEPGYFGSFYPVPARRARQTMTYM